MSAMVSFARGAIKYRRPVIVCLLLSSAFVSAQEVKFIDLTNLQPKTALRFKPGIPLCPPGKKPCVVDGYGGEIVDEGVLDLHDPHALGISLDSVSTTNITVDPFAMELRIVNTGSAPIDVPVWGDLSDLQPADAWQPFNYLSLSVLVLMGRPVDPGIAGMTGIILYGSADRPETIISLKPGQWIRVKARMKLNPFPTQRLYNLQLSGSFLLDRDQFTPQPGGGFFRITHLRPNETQFPGIPVNFSPARSNLTRLSQ